MPDSRISDLTDLGSHGGFGNPGPEPTSGRSNNDNLEDSGLAAARHKWNGEPHTLLVSATWLLIWPVNLLIWPVDLLIGLSSCSLNM